MILILKRKEWDKYAQHVEVLNHETGEVQKCVEAIQAAVEQQSASIKCNEENITVLNTSMAKVDAVMDVILKIVWAEFAVTIIAVLGAVISGIIGG